MNVNFYKLFLWVVLGVPLIVLGVVLLGSIGWTMYGEIMGGEFSLLKLLAIFLWGPFLVLLSFGILGGTDVLETSRDLFFAWLSCLIFLVVVFVIPTIIMIFVRGFF